MVVSSFGCFCHCFGLVYCAIRVIGWGVDRVEFEWLFRRSVDYVVERASRDYYCIAIVNQMLFSTAEDEFSFAFFDAEELVNGMMDLVSDLFTRLQAHNNQLGICAGVQHLAEIVVFLSQFFNVSNETSHRICLLNPDIW